MSSLGKAFLSVTVILLFTVTVLSLILGFNVKQEKEREKELEAITANYVTVINYYKGLLSDSPERAETDQSLGELLQFGAELLRESERLREGIEGAVSRASDIDEGISGVGKSLEERNSRIEEILERQHELYRSIGLTD